MDHFSLFTDFDVYLFKEGTHFKLHEKFGSHLVNVNGVDGTYFAVWAPNARQVSVVGNFNEWNTEKNILRAKPDGSGIWEAFLPGIKKGDLYKYHVKSHYNNYEAAKADPFACFAEMAPHTASIVWDLSYDWKEKMDFRRNNPKAPISVYEVHMGSWKRVPEEENRWMNYREMAGELVKYVHEMGFTHVEFMPITEYPFYESWGYQALGYFAPSSRFGEPQDFMYLVDTLHQNGIGVLLDWVPSHFPTDDHGLARFDGTFLYEHEDPRKGFHPDWRSAIFNYGRNEVKCFLVSSATFWVERYHVDCLRVDAVASMLYLDYSRRDGEWIPNKYGGRENIEAIDFIRQFNKAVHDTRPQAITIAEDSTAWPMVSGSILSGGLGFDMKWNMGWMHDTLDYLSKDPVHRKFHHDQLKLSISYAFSENFVLSLSHDEVVHGKRSLLEKMPGTYWQKFATLRLLYGYMFGHPGKKLLFMGSEFGQKYEWNHHQSLDWHLLEDPFHKGAQKWVKDLNWFYRSEPVLYETDFDYRGFEWVDCFDWEKSTLTFLRKCESTDEIIVVSCNFTPIPRENFRLGVPHGGIWKEVLNSDAKEYAGSGVGNMGKCVAEEISHHGRDYSILVTLPPLGMIFLKSKPDPNIVPKKKKIAAQDTKKEPQK
ncbi:MAG TPA: 1,4-alpha-glucan branching protein GlgB [Candidatus Omnitrophota bacterium]|nr:1,4-alpha-glucan branching protein GlgB [Candidatus Omnitrophota bacterium]